MFPLFCTPHYCCILVVLVRTSTAVNSTGRYPRVCTQSTLNSNKQQAYEYASTIIVPTISRISGSLVNVFILWGGARGYQYQVCTIYINTAVLYS